MAASRFPFKSTAFSSVALTNPSIGDVFAAVMLGLLMIMDLRLIVAGSQKKIQQCAMMNERKLVDAEFHLVHWQKCLY
ncbi:hypothetical protein BpHYR1_002508 [Brachionus plicatilis]|uniref:Uncharacterized protein n=1 Tax=Brachionus plicatilis TaxID=10195 RepID=A0A3M7PBK7_BRAPC|nr:hypothetical protein BpHYR1_002508 [Brachionus plicatilis]